MDKPQPTRPASLAELPLALVEGLRGSLRDCRGKPYYLLEDPVTGRFFRVGVREWQLARRLDGRRTVAEAYEQAREESPDGYLDLSEAAAFCQWLQQAQLAEVRGVAGHAAAPAGWRALAGRFNPFFILIPLVNPDRFLAAALPAVRWMLGPVFFAFWAILCGAGAWHVAADWERFAASAEGILAPANWLWLLAIWIGLKLVHELFHGLVCKKYGGTVPKAGVMLILFSPIAFVDVTSSWRFRSKWQRIATSAAGMYIELGVAALAALVWSHTGPGIVNHLCHNLVVTASLMTILFNANFLMRFDGYYILSDLFDEQNLYAAGRQHLVYFVRRYLCGLPARAPQSGGTRGRLIRAYGVAAMLWRVVLYAGLIAIATSMFYGAGLVLSLFGGIIWFGLPLVRLGRFLVGGEGRSRHVRLHLAATLSSAAAAAVLVGGLPSPTGVTAPAVVEYSPLEIVRTDGPGFVRRLAVGPGQIVEEGQVLALLENDELTRELADLRLAIELSRVKSRILHRDEKLAEYQVEEDNRRALETKLREQQQRVDRLTLRAPIAGRIVGRDLESLIGSHFEAGQALLAIGTESAKELKVSVAQQDVEAFQDALGTAPRVRVRGAAGVLEGAWLSRVNPKARRTLPHEALSAAAGGPLAVRAAVGDESAETEQTFELVDSRFEARLELPPAEAAGLRAGQLAWVRLRGPGPTVANHLAAGLGDWLRTRLDPHTAAQRLDF